MLKKLMEELKQMRSGSILPFAMMIVVLLVLLGLGLTRLGQDARVTSAKTVSQIVARSAADAGFTQAVQLMNQKLANKPWSGEPISAETDVSLPNSNATFSYTVTKNSNYYEVASTGKAGFAEKTVRGRLFLESLLFGIGVKESIDIMVGATFTVPLDKKFAVRTNSIADNAIVFKSGILIPGDVICGPGGNPDKVVNEKSSTTITGDSYAASDKIDFPSVVLPADLKNASMTSYNYKAATPIVGSADPNNPEPIKFNQIDIPNGGVQEIQGHCKIYVVGTTTLRQSAELIVASGASVSLYLGQDMEAKNSNGIDNLNFNMPGALMIYGLDSCKSIDLKAKGSSFFGYAYAPEAALNVYAKNQLAGAFISKSFSLKNSTNFTFIPPSGVYLNDPTSYLLVRWWEE